MSEKVVVVGGNAGGLSCAARLRRLSEEKEIVIFEKKDYISWANCGLPYYIGDVIEKRRDLIIQKPEDLSKRFNLDIRTKTKALDIDPVQKFVEVEDLEKGKKYEELFDKLVLSPGAKTVTPPIKGLEKVEKVFNLNNLDDADLIKQTIDGKEIDKVLVVGAGFIGLEMVENLKEKGLDVAIVEMLNQVMQPLDYDMAAMVHNNLRKNGVDLYLEELVSSIKEKNGKAVPELESGGEIETDMVLLATGVRPNSKLAEKAGIEIGENGAVETNSYLETSVKDIYAVGDLINVEDSVTGDKRNIPLAGPANKQGRTVANNIEGLEDRYGPVTSNFIVKLFNLTIASAGVNEKMLSKKDLKFEKVFTCSKNHSGYYPGAEKMWIKTIFNKKTGKLYGAQIVGKKGVDKRIDILATAIKHGKTVFDLQELDLAYSPPFSSAKDPVNMAGFAASNIVNGLMEVRHWNEVEELVSEEKIVLDCRTGNERQEGYIEGSLHIPLNQLRDREEEIPKEKEIFAHCQIGLRSYFAQRMLSQKGYNAYNLSGGYGVYQQIKMDQMERKKD